MSEEKQNEIREKLEGDNELSQEQLDQVREPSEGDPALPTQAADLGDNPDLEQEVEQDNELKRWFIQYCGDKYKPEDNQVTVAMAVQAFMEDFPEFLMVVAEENWIRGYKQGVFDSEAGVKMALEQAGVDVEQAQINLHATTPQAKAAVAAADSVPQEIDVPPEVVEQMQADADADGDE